MQLQDEITRSIDPGDDFYNYVNKKWCDAHPVPADKARYSVLTELNETVTTQLRELLEESIKGNESKSGTLARKLYASGMDVPTKEASLDCALSLLREVEDVHEIKDVKTLISKRHSEGRALLWHVGIDVDGQDSQRYVMAISQRGLLLPNRDYYFEKDERFEKIQIAYKEFLGKLFKLLGKDDITDQVNNVYEIEKSLAAVSNTSIENRDVEAKYNPFTFEELAERFVGFDWSVYRDTVGLNNVNGLIIQQPKFLEGVISAFDMHSLEAWRDYLVAHTVVPYMPFLAKEYDDIHFAFFGTVLTGAEHQEDRYRRVIRTVSSLLPEPVGQLYVEAHFDETAKIAITDLVNHIQDALRERINKLEWTSEKTKHKALEKLDTFMPLLGYPDTWRSYDSLELQDDYVVNILAIRKFEWHYDLARIAESVNREEWLMSPATVNAYYWSSTNGITFPAAILQPPMFDPAGDFAANYGAIGMVIGHEIIHGFDDEGSKYDKVGNLRSWWTSADRKAFEKRAKALIRQYDQYEIDGKHVKGKLTLGENIADLGGVLIAYDAMQKMLAESGKTTKVDGFTPEQRFFLSQARIWRTNIRPELALQFLVSDPHSPAHLRVNGVITNVDAWYEAWDLKATNALYRPVEERVRIW